VTGAIAELGPALAYEWVRLRTSRATWRLIAVAVAGTLLVGIALAALLLQMVRDGSVTVSPLEADVVVLTKSPVTPLVAGLLGVLAMGNEYRYGTIRTTLLVTPDRWRAFLAKLALVSVTAIAMVCVNLVLGWMVIGLMLRSHPLPGGQVPTVLRAQAGQAVIIVGWAVIGLALAALTRSQTAAILLLLADAYLVEPGLRLGLRSAPGPLSAVPDYLPLGAAGTLTDVSGSVAQGSTALTVSSSSLAPWVGGGVFVLFVALLAVTAGIVFVRRDAQ